MWTGAELEQLVNEASWLAVEENSPITTEIMLKAMKTIKPELSERKKRLQEYIKIYNSLENADPYFQQQISQTEDAVIASLFDNL
jgi:SpoVK/Ycf46/Vps4 family AAA+-type ATPase